MVRLSLLTYLLHRAAIVVVLWMVAMVIGCLYKRLFMGAKGWEQVPLLEFYREFGNLESVSIATHCLLTIEVFCCAPL